MIWVTHAQKELACWQMCLGVNRKPPTWSSSKPTSNNRHHHQKAPSLTNIAGLLAAMTDLTDPVPAVPRQMKCRSVSAQPIDCIVATLLIKLSENERKRQQKCEQSLSKARGRVWRTGELRMNHSRWWEPRGCPKHQESKTAKKKTHRTGVFVLLSRSPRQLHYLGSMRRGGVVARSQSAHCNNQQLRASLKAIIAPDVQHFSMNTGLQGNKVLAFK